MSRWRNSKEIIRYLRKSCGFILPSKYEPWGVVVHEAACSGLPLILSDSVGSRNELLINNHNGRVSIKILLQALVKQFNLSA